MIPEPKIISLLPQTAVMGYSGSIRQGFEAAIEVGALGSMAGVFVTKKGGKKQFIPEANIREITVSGE